MKYIQLFNYAHFPDKDKIQKKPVNGTANGKKDSDADAPVIKEDKAAKEARKKKEKEEKAKAKEEKKKAKEDKKAEKPAAAATDDAKGTKREASADGKRTKKPKLSGMCNYILPRKLFI